jgi:HEAT repeat protein
LDNKCKQIEALGKLRDNKVLEVILSNFDDQHPSIRESCAFALGHLGSSMAVELLINHLSDKDGNVRSAIIQSLGLLKASVALHYLEKVVQTDTGFTYYDRKVSTIASSVVKELKLYDHK